jgi:hypothetical protein
MVQPMRGVVNAEDVTLLQLNSAQWQDTFTTVNQYSGEWNNEHTLRHDSGTIVYGMTGRNVQTIVLSGDQTFTNSYGMAAGDSILVRLSAYSTSKTLSWNSQWKFIGGKPTSMAADKIALVSVLCFGTLSSDVVCTYAVED